MSTAHLQEQRDALYAEWIAASRPRDGELWDRCRAAVRALADAKRRDEADASSRQTELLAAAKAAVKQRQQDQRNAEALRRAERLYQQAQEWPRCGQDWPMDRYEQSADALLRKVGLTTGAR